MQGCLSDKGAVIARSPSQAASAEGLSHAAHQPVPRQCSRLPPWCLPQEREPLGLARERLPRFPLHPCLKQVMLFRAP